MTFEEWWESVGYDPRTENRGLARVAWQTATEQKDAEIARLLAMLMAVSEQLAEWSLNGGSLDYGNGRMSSHEQKQLEQLEVLLENVIVPADGEW